MKIAWHINLYAEHINAWLHGMEKENGKGTY